MTDDLRPEYDLAELTRVPEIHKHARLPNLSIVPAGEIPKASDCPLDRALDVYKICQKLEKVCILEHGIGISAVQVGLPYKLFITLIGETRYFANCEYECLNEKVDSVEGCLSLRNSEGGSRLFKVKRSTEIVVSGYELIANEKPKFKEFRENFKDLAAIVMQHEIDHQNDILISSGVELFYAK